MHRDLNSPFREDVAFHIGRLIGANTAEVVVNQDSILSALSFTTDPKSLPQKTRETAEAANLVFDIFIRKWDDTVNWVQRSPVGKTFVAFDHDQAFNAAIADVSAKAW